MERLPNLDAIQSFLTVAEDLNFRRAAARLNLDQSALSRRIKELEALLGFTLFQRTTREVRLTPAGQAFYDSNQALVDGLRDAVSLARRTADGVSGHLRVGYMSFAAMTVMPERVRAFRELHPNVSMDLLYFRTQAQRIELARRSLDVGFMIGPFHHTDFRTALVSEERLVALIPAGHEAGRCGTATLAALNEAGLVIGTMAQWDVYREMLHGVFAEKGLSMAVSYEASSTMGIFGLVAAGLGITIFPKCVRRMQPACVDIVEITDCDARIQTVLAWRRDELSVAARNFLRVCEVD